MIGAALLVALSGQAVQSPADGVPPIAQETAELESNATQEGEVRSHWFARTGVAGALYNSGAKIAAGGVVVPGATVKIADDVTAMLDIGYNISDSLAVQVMVGIPPRAAAIGKGTVAPFGTLGSVRLGPVIATGVYRLPYYGGFRPYVGAGGTYVFILKDSDGAVTDLNVRGNWGAVLQAGLEYRVNRRLELFADYKRLWVKVRAEGMLGPAPARARVTLDPDLVSAGIKLNFR